MHLRANPGRRARNPNHTLQEIHKISWVAMDIRTRVRMTGATFQVVTLTLTPTLTLTLIEVVLISQQFYPRPQKGS